MDKAKKISFHIRGGIFSGKISPTNVTLPILKEFVEQVEAFIKGKNRLNLDEVRTSIEDSSLAIVAESATEVLSTAIIDYEKIEKFNNLEGVDPVRAEIVDRWQKMAQETGREYELCLSSGGDLISSISINGRTEIKRSKAIWVDVDLYLYGRIFDMGGKNSPNVHIELENGNTIKINSNTSILAEVKENKLYKNQLLRISAKRNVETRALKDEKLISFDKYNPHFDEEEFSKASRKATVAWASIKNTTDWLEELRGNYE